MVVAIYLKRHIVTAYMHKQNNINKLSGFSLVEMAVVIMLIGVLMTFGIKLATSFQDRAGFTATKNKQTLLKEALISYLAQNGRLPCPANIATPPNGVESINPAGDTCSSNPGIIPYATLGIPKDTVLDGWDRLFLYEVTNANHACATNWVKAAVFDTSTIKTYHDGEVGCVTIEEDNNGDGTVDNTRSDRVAVIVSNGPNGEGGYTSKGVLTSLDETITTATHEKNNILSHSGKTPHTFRIEPVTLTKFDDVVLELSANDLLQPIKRDGSIVSLNQIAKNYFDTNISVSPTCKLTYIGTPLLPPPQANLTPVILNITTNGQTFTKTLVGSDYGCPSGFTYP